MVDSYPVDVSPFGVRGVSGNVQDWCLEPAYAPHPVVDQAVAVPEAGEPESMRLVRGGNWVSTSDTHDLAGAEMWPSQTRDATLGFRGCYRPDPRPD